MRNQLLNAIMTSSKDFQLILSPDDFYLLILLSVYEFFLQKKELSGISSGIGLVTDIISVLAEQQENTGSSDENQEYRKSRKEGRFS